MLKVEFWIIKVLTYDDRDVLFVNWLFIMSRSNLKPEIQPVLTTLLINLQPKIISLWPGFAAVK